MTDICDQLFDDREFCLKLAQRTLPSIDTAIVINIVRDAQLRACGPCLQLHCLDLSLKLGEQDYVFTCETFR